MYMQVSNKKYMYFEIDEKDFDRVAKYKWSLGKDGYLIGYTGNYKNSLLHRFILDLKIGDGKIIDHRDMDKCNNKKENLRLCDTRLNTANTNKSKLNTSGYKGVHWNKNGDNWKAIIYDNKKQVNLGLYSDIIEAAREYDRAAVNVFGEFARLNFDIDNDNHFSKHSLPVSRLTVKFTSAFLGVSKKKRNNGWCLHFENEYIGLFLDEETAAKAYNQLAINKYGDLAELNNIEIDKDTDYLSTMIQKHSSKYKGVSLRGKSWIATCNNKYLGSFTSELDAAICRDKHIIDNGLDISRLNFSETKNE